MLMDDTQPTSDIFRKSSFRVVDVSENDSAVAVINHPNRFDAQFSLDLNGTLYCLRCGVQLFSRYGSGTLWSHLGLAGQKRKRIPGRPGRLSCKSQNRLLHPRHLNIHVALVYNHQNREV